MINVTKTFLPPLEEYTAFLERIWKSKWITNRGELVLELEEKLKDFLKVTNILITNNGTIPLQIALKIVGKKSEIITTPFSYIATSSSIVWENCKPVFVDIDLEHLTIDETKIEEKITPNTSAILATHVFGNPCHIEAIEKIAKKHDLKVIYDGAHAFGVNYQGKSIFTYGDISTCSFHATKLFHTGEGGAFFTNDVNLLDDAFHKHNFGHKDELTFYGLGINGKISELQAAMGLAVFPHISSILEERKQIITCYRENLDWNKLKTIKIRKNTEWNYSYFPIIFESEEKLLEIQLNLNAKDIFPRRYFYPSLNTIDYLKSEEMPNSESIAKRILCLPLYPGLDLENVKLISEIINGK